MTYQELEDLLKTLRYKKGTHFTINRNLASGFVRIGLTALVQDVNDHGSLITLYSGLDTDEIERCSKNEMIEKIWALIKSHEMHEAMEWFMVNGEQVYDPHPRK